MNQGKEFLTNTEAEPVVEQLAERCLEILETGNGDTGAFPDPTEFFADKGVDLPEGGSLRLTHTITKPNMQPAKPVCEDGYDGCVPRCKIIRGEQVCVWVCHCP